MNRELLVKTNPVDQKFEPIVNHINAQNFDQALSMFIFLYNFLK